jgi:ribosomal protein S8
MIDKSAKIIHSINLSAVHKRSTINIKYVSSGILKKLYQLNIIKGFYKTNSNYIIKTNSTKNFNIFIKNFCRVGSKIHFTKNQLVKNKNHFFSTIYILSTPYGLLTQYEVIDKNIGGFLVAKILLK